MDRNRLMDEEGDSFITINEKGGVNEKFTKKMQRIIYDFCSCPGACNPFIRRT
jgi:hypothetical protein